MQSLNKNKNIYFAIFGVSYIFSYIYNGETKRQEITLPSLRGFYLST